jgi:hypothetical protein
MLAESAIPQIPVEEGKYRAYALEESVRRIKFFAALVLVGYLLPRCQAHDRDWQAAVFLGFNSSQNGTAMMPIGTGSVTVPIRTANYWFRTPAMDFCLWMPSRLSGRTPNLTIHGATKISVEGRHVHVLDDDGKDWKMTIVTKVARN